MGNKPKWLGLSRSSQSAAGSKRARAQWRERGDRGESKQPAIVKVNLADANGLIALSRRRDGQEKEEKVRD